MYSDTFTPFDDIQCEDAMDIHHEEITIPVDFDPDVEYDDDADFIPLADDSGDWAIDPEPDVVVDFVNDDGSLTDAGQEYLAQLDAEGAFV